MISQEEWKLKEARRQAFKPSESLVTPSELTFNSITALAAVHFKSPISMIYLVDSDRVWLHSSLALDYEMIDQFKKIGSTGPGKYELYVVADACEVPELRTLPIVSEFGWRFYAGISLIGHDGYHFGTLCIIDKKPRKISQNDINYLKALSSIITEQMKLIGQSKRLNDLFEQLEVLHSTLTVKARTDLLTNMPNRESVLLDLEKLLDRSRREKKPLALLIMDLDDFKKINDSYGHQAGDQVLMEVARRLKKVIRKSDSLGRIGGEEFLLVLYPSHQDKSLELGNRIIKAISSKKIRFKDASSLSLTISIGISTFDYRNIDEKYNDLMKHADQALYMAKKHGKNRIVLYQDPNTLQSKLQT